MRQQRLTLCESYIAYRPKNPNLLSERKVSQNSVTAYGSATAYMMDDAAEHMLKAYSRYLKAKPSQNSLQDDPISPTESALKAGSTILGSLGAVGSILGVLPTDNDDQKSFSLTLINSTDHAFVPRSVHLAGQYYAQKNFGPIGPNESTELTFTINHSYNPQDSDEGYIYIYGVMAHASSGKTVSIGVNITEPNNNNNKTWHLQAFNSDEFGDVRYDESTNEVDHNTRLRYIECRASSPNDYPSFGLSMYCQTANLPSYVLVITPVA